MCALDIVLYCTIEGNIHKTMKIYTYVINFKVQLINYIYYIYKQ